jgi:hypothetical protein
MKKQLLACCLLPLLLCSTGCTATQVKDRLYLQALELSQATQPSVQLHPFSTSSESTSTYSGRGATLATALEATEISSGKSLFLGHLELLCLHDAAFVGELPDLIQSYQLSFGCKAIYTSNTLTDTDTEALLESLKQEEQNGRLPETDLLSILKESSGTTGIALMPIRITNRFSMVLIQPDGIQGTLSSDAVQGLCFLRGKNYPDHITVSTDDTTSDFFITHAITKYHAVIANGIPIVTVSLTLWGTGDADALQTRLETICEAAETETVTQYRADVIGLEDCIRQQCYAFYQEQDWNSILHTVQFQNEITIYHSD